MTEGTGSPSKGAARSRWARGIRGVVLVALVFATSVVVAIVSLAVTETRIALPDAATDRIERRIDSRLPGLSLDLGDVLVAIDRTATPRLWLSDLTLSGDNGRIASLRDVGLVIDGGAFLAGRIAPRALRVDGADAILRRDADGAFLLSFGGGTDVVAKDPGALLDAIDAAFSAPPFDRIEEVSLSGTTIAIEDARSGRTWQLSDGEASLARRDGGMEFDVAADLFNGTDDVARLALAITTGGADGGATLSAELSGVAAGDIALQAPVLRVLDVLDAPLSGALTARFGSDGALRNLDGRLDIGPGALQPRPETRPVTFSRANVAFTFDGATGRVDLSEISVASDLGEGRLRGHVYLDVPPGAAIPAGLTGQFTILETQVDAPELLAGPVAIDDGALDLRVRLDPLHVEIGELVLPDPGGDPERHLRASGRVAAESDGWHVAADLAADRASAERIAALWPLDVAPGTRQWFTGRVIAADATDLAGALRWSAGTPPELAVSFAIADATVQAVDFLPPVTDGEGYLSIQESRLALSLDAGSMRGEDRGPVDLAGTTVVLPDTRVKPARAEITLRTAGALPDLLALADAPPLSFLSRAGRDPDIADGRATATVSLELPLMPGLGPDDIDVSVDGELRDVVSERIVPGRRLTAERMDLVADQRWIRARGRAELDGVAFDGSWRQSLAGEDRGTGVVEGDVTVTPAALSTFGIALPDGLIRGEGRAAIELVLAPDAAPRIEVDSDLAGLGMSIPAVNWSKARDRTGQLTLSGRLGEALRIDSINLEAPGLAARGRVEFGAGPSFRALILDRVVLGDWLDAPVTIASQGPGRPPAITVRDGRIDLRQAEFAADGNGRDGSGAARGPIRLSLDRLTVTDTIAFSPARVDLAAGRDLSGIFSGRLNGGVSVSGDLSGGPRGVSMRLESADAGAVLRDAGLIDRVRGGRLELVLRPTSEAGSYDGQVRVDDVRIQRAPVIAEILSAISVVGLIEQLDGQGIMFDEVAADFRLTPRRITLFNSSATGNSLGLSLDGVYDTVARRMDMQGVVSPVYFLNRVGSIFTRRGEGLFGANFTLEGPARSPRVSVNPLSILTPGRFREVFRRPPPTRSGQ